MTNALVAVLVALAAISLGLRATGVLLPRLHPLARVVVSAVIGWLLATATLRICDAYQVHDLGLGLLVSLTPVGVYDLLKWWFRWRVPR
jgi:hypothetical protein